MNRDVLGIVGAFSIVAATALVFGCLLPLYYGAARSDCETRAARHQAIRALVIERSPYSARIYQSEMDRNEAHYISDIEECQQ